MDLLEIEIVNTHLEFPMIEIFNAGSFHQSPIICFSKTHFYLLFLLLILLFCFGPAKAQIKSNSRNKDSLIRNSSQTDFRNQRDLVDLEYLVLGKDPNKRLDSTGKRNNKVHFSGSPSIEFSASTGLAVLAIGNFAYYSKVDTITNISAFLVGVGYTAKHQFYIPIQSSLWTTYNRFNLLGDWRFDRFPLDTYGFGGHSKLSEGYTVVDNRVRFYEFSLKHIFKSFYMGFGVQFDYHWNIHELLDSATRKPTDFEIYGYHTTSNSTGLAVDLLYDTRKNSINPEAGAFYGNLVFRQNFSLLGSNSNWNSVLLDLRKYIQLPFHEILALWSYNNFTLIGNPPYLDLPGTANDTYGNTGRGYVINRFIGKKMLYLEAEIRYRITRNGLIGGVFFANAQSQSELKSNQFEVISPGYGGGIRIKFNKLSKTNICLDYGIGSNGSHGIFANLGEVF